MAAEVDGRRARGAASRSRVLALAGDVASIKGLDGLTLGELSSELGLSKSNVHALFGGSREKLQEATIHAARARFIAAVVQPVTHEERGLPFLTALLRSWLGYIERDTFQGGCLFVRTVSELQQLPVALQDQILAARSEWLQLLATQVQIAIESGQLGHLDVDLFLFELDCALVGANSARLAGDRLATTKAQILIDAAIKRAAAR